MARTSNINREEVVGMYLEGMSQRDIANAIGVTPQTIGYQLRKAGICVGSGRGMGEGGYVARTIPKKDYMAKAETEKQEMAQKNAANACLVVSDKSFSLQGQVGKYEVSAKACVVFASIGDNVVELEVDKLAVLADELKAVARGLAGVQVGCEMW